jgi:two-component system response regulator HydG
MTTHRILVVDDDIGVCTVLSRILKDQQYDVYISQSVSGAAETLAESSFDAYLLDYRLSDGTGLQVAEKVRQHGSTAPIILISGYGATDVAAKAPALEIFEVLQKPFTRETICGALERALSQALPAPFAEPAITSRTTEPAFRMRLHPLLVILIAVALIVVAFCIFLMLR